MLVKESHIEKKKRQTEQNGRGGRPEQAEGDRQGAQEGDAHCTVAQSGVVARCEADQRGEAKNHKRAEAFVAIQYVDDEKKANFIFQTSQ